MIITFSKIAILTTFKEGLNLKKYAHKRIAEEAMHVEQNIYAEELNKIEPSKTDDVSTLKEDIIPADKEEGSG